MTVKKPKNGMLFRLVIVIFISFFLFLFLFLFSSIIYHGKKKIAVDEQALRAAVEQCQKDQLHFKGTDPDLNISSCRTAASKQDTWFTPWFWF